jgi:hypothetical protein
MSEFNAANVEVIQNAISQVRILGDLLPCKLDSESLQIHIRNKVKPFQKQLLSEPGSKVDNIHQSLEILRVWSLGFEGMSESYEEALKHISGFIGMTCKCISEFEKTDLSTVEPTRLSSHVEHLRCLSSICRAADRLSLHDLDVRGAVGTLTSAKQNFVAALDAWKIKSTPSRIQGDELKIIASRTHTVELLQGLLEKSSAGRELITVVANLRNELGDMVGRRFAHLFATVKQDCPRHSGPEWKQPLAILRSEVDLFSGLKGDHWKEIQLGYNSAVDHVKEVLQARLLDL